MYKQANPIIVQGGKLITQAIARDIGNAYAKGPSALIEPKALLLGGLGSSLGGTGGYYLAKYLDYEHPWLAALGTGAVGGLTGHALGVSLAKGDNS